jgi:paraquat-inducible protein B
MEKKKFTYEEITGYIRNVSPVLENPEELTQNIMAQIKQTTKTKKKHKIIRVTGLLSGAAACLLLCLFAYENIQLSEHSCNTDVKRISITDGKMNFSKPEIKQMIHEKLKNKSRKERIYTLYSTYKQKNNSK